MHTESPTWNEIFLFLQMLSIVIGIIIIGLLYALVCALSKRKPTVDDPTGEKKQKIFDSLNKAIEDIKSTV